MPQIDSNEFYTIHDPTWLCCDEVQFTYYCKAHNEKMGCYYCEFDYSEPCGHED